MAGTVRLEFAENTGGMLSLGSDLSPFARTAIFTAGAAALLAALAAAAIRFRWRGLQLAGMCLLFAGGASNILDRIFRGSVVDFVSIGIGNFLRTGIFNVADVAIFAGVILMWAFPKQKSDATRESTP
jgi:signal peptidase II